MDSVLLDENLSYEEEPVAILDREVRKLRSRDIASVKVQWKNRSVEESTWEKEVDMQEKYPHLFTDSGTPFRPCFSSCDRSRTISGKIGRDDGPHDGPSWARRTVEGVSFQNTFFLVE